MIGLQTYNSMRALDFLCSLADVDPQQIVVTEASGGGTQTIFLCAIDQRPCMAFPAVMVSTSMQRGCPCENAPYLRISAGNINFAALIAPRRLGMTGADDWTRELVTRGLPELKDIYRLFHAEDQVEATVLPQFEHNFNAASRLVLYRWLQRHLPATVSEPTEERDFVPLSNQEMCVWDETHPPPLGEQQGDRHERALLAWMTEDARQAINRLVPQTAEDLVTFSQVVGGAYEVLLGRRWDEVGPTQLAVSRQVEQDDYEEQTGLLSALNHQEQLPIVQLYPRGRKTVATVVWVHGHGRRGLWDPPGILIKEVMRLLSAGMAVICCIKMTFFAATQGRKAPA